MKKKGNRAAACFGDILLRFYEGDLGLGEERIRPPDGITFVTCVYL